MFQFFKNKWLLMRNSVYCTVCVQIDVSRHSWNTFRWWPYARLKCVSGQRRLKIFLRCIYVFDLVLKYRLHINEGFGIQLLFYFVIFMNIVSPPIRLSFFSYVGHVFALNFFSYCRVTETFAIGFQNRFD